MSESFAPRASKRYRQLAFGLISVLLLPPFLSSIFPHANLVAALVFAVLVARTVVVKGESRLLRFVMAIAAMAVALRASSANEALREGPWSLGLGLRVVTVLGFMIVVVALLQRVLEAGPVDSEKLFAAVAAYLMIGLAFASVYEALAHCKPGAFRMTGERGSDLDGLFYFSLVTLSTVGYGDILPNAPEARVLAVLEAITGQLYLAILMARLVGLHLNQSNTALEFNSPKTDGGDKFGEEPRAGTGKG